MERSLGSRRDSGVVSEALRQRIRRTCGGIRNISVGLGGGGFAEADEFAEFGVVVQAV